MDGLRIVLLNTQMEPAGAQKAMLELARGLVGTGYQVTVVTMYDKADYVPFFQNRYGLTIVDLGMKRPGQPLPGRVLSLVWGLLHLYRLLRSWRPHILQTFSHYSNLVGPVVAWLAGTPIRVSSQRMSLRGAPRWLLWLDRAVANSFLVAKMISVSEATRRFCIERGIRPTKIVTIPNGIDPIPYDGSGLSSGRARSLRRELGLTELQPVVITVARLHRQKGHCFLIEAVPRVLNTFPDARFLFVGEGELRAELEAKVVQARLDSAIRFLGVRRDIPQLLAISDIFVLPSLWEGLPNVALEAMAAGVPVVATRVDGTPEVVVDGQTGLLVPPADAAALAEAVCRLLGDEALCRSMAAAAQARVRDVFSQERTLAAYTALYQELVQAKGGAL